MTYNKEYNYINNNTIIWITVSKSGGLGDYPLYYPIKIKKIIQHFLSTNEHIYYRYHIFSGIPDGVFQSGPQLEASIVKNGWLPVQLGFDCEEDAVLFKLMYGIC